eukprot:TRINITY_DN4053_c1_g1_i2.p1 TRINITY_DN4053_c1_g1~~TRINITY_DN4053_c1_g1_i2.p1  ORF type:complete len:1001 (+),score=266.53 TRINITY_DN4053_c1_g1_i2:38-3040(+)
MSRSCSKCGKVAKPNHSFCMDCGNPIPKEEVSVSSPVNNRVRTDSPPMNVYSRGQSSSDQQRESSPYKRTSSPGPVNKYRRMSSGPASPSNVIPPSPGFSSSTKTVSTVNSPPVSNFSQSANSSPYAKRAQSSQDEAKEIVCSSCHQVCKRSFKFCEHCGSKIETSEAQKSKVTASSPNPTDITDSPSRLRNRSRSNSTNIGQSSGINRYRRGSETSHEESTDIKTNSPSISRTVSNTSEGNTNSPSGRYRRLSLGRAPEKSPSDITESKPNVPIPTIVEDPVDNEGPSRCTNCSTKLRPHAKFCEGCGTRTTDMEVKTIEDYDKEIQEVDKLKSKLYEKNIDEQEKTKQKTKKKKLQLKELKLKDRKDLQLSNTLSARSKNRLKKLPSLNFELAKMEDAERKADRSMAEMQDYWDSALDGVSEDQDKESLIKLSYKLGLVQDETPEEINRYAIRTPRGVAPRADTFLVQMKGALERNLEELGISEEQLKETVNSQQTLLEKVQMLESLLNNEEQKKLELEQEKLYEELQKDIQKKLDSFQEQMEKTTRELQEKREKEQNDSEEITKLEENVQSLSGKVEQYMMEMKKIQEDKAQAEMDRLERLLAEERRNDRSREIDNIKQAIEREEENRMVRDKKLLEVISQMEKNLQETAEKLEIERELRKQEEEKRREQEKNGGDDFRKEEMDRYFRRMEEKLKKQEEEKERERIEQEEKIRRLEEALADTQRELKKERDRPASTPEINLDGQNIMSSIEEMMMKMMGSKMSSLESKLKSLEGRALSGGGPVRDYETIQAEIADLQVILFDPDTPEKELERINIEFEKLMSELEKTPEFLEQQEQHKREWKENNEGPNQEAFEQLRSKLENMRTKNPDEFREKLIASPMLKLILMTPDQILKKHQNDFKQYLLSDYTLKHLRAVFFALPDFRSDQEVQKQLVENMILKIDEYSTNPRPKRKKKKVVKRAAGLPPPPPPKIKVNTAPASSGPGDLFAELLKSRQRVE